MQRTTLALAAALTAIAAGAGAANLGPGHEISCGDGVDILRAAGFANVTPQICEGRTLTFLATRDGQRVLVRVDEDTGKIRGYSVVR